MARGQTERWTDLVLVLLLKAILMNQNRGKQGRHSKFLPDAQSRVIRQTVDLLGVGSAVEGLPHEPEQRQAGQPQCTGSHKHAGHGLPKSGLQQKNQDLV